MNKNIDLLRLACLIQDRNNQDFKRVVLSLIFEILYENNNSALNAGEIYNTLVTKSKEPIDRDFFDNLILNSNSFEVINTNDEPLIKLTHKKMAEVEGSISEFSIEPSIIKFLQSKNYNVNLKSILLKILYQSIYENVYTFNPSDISSLVPDIIKEKFTQFQLDIFNEFLEYDDPEKNRRLYNQFVKAIEFAILTSGKGVKHFSENIYAGKAYILDTNIIFRMLGIGGLERKGTIIKLLKSCIKQGVKFEYTSRTYQELQNTLEASINKISKGELSHKIEIIQEMVAQSPHFFVDDFIVHYSKLKNNREVNNPEHFGLKLQSEFRQLCIELNITQANHDVKIENYEIEILAKRLISERKKITSYRYSSNQARVDAYNVLYVEKRRGTNNFNYSDVKSFYLTTDRGLNKILSEGVSLIPATILPSQLFAIHNPLFVESDEVDYENFFSFIKRRTSEFKHRGRDIFSFINQARLYTTNKDEIKGLILTFSDGRYKSSKDDAVDENIIIRFKDFAKTYFDNRLQDIEDIEQKWEIVESKGESNLKFYFQKSKRLVTIYNILITVIVIPVISALAGFISNVQIFFTVLVILEGVKFWINSRGNYSQEIWKRIFISKMKHTPYYELTGNNKYIDQGLENIKSTKDILLK